MKLSFYFDVYGYESEGMDILASTKPTTKMDSATRYRMDVEIPDPRKPDHVVKAEAVEVKE